jgi:type I restriction enzyme R subunit
LQRIKERRESHDVATQQRLLELEELAREASRTKEEPQRLNLTEKGEYALFSVLRSHSNAADDYVAECARRMVGHLQTNKVTPAGWSTSKGGRMRVEQSLLAESWNLFYADLGFDVDDPSPQFLREAVEELARSDG